MQNSKCKSTRAHVHAVKERCTLAKKHVCTQLSHAYQASLHIWDSSKVRICGSVYVYACLFVCMNNVWRLINPNRFNRKIQSSNAKLWPGYKTPLVLEDNQSDEQRESIIVEAIFRYRITLVTRSFGRGTDFVCRDTGLVRNGKPCYRFKLLVRTKTRRHFVRMYMHECICLLKGVWSSKL